MVVIEVSEKSLFVVLKHVCVNSFIRLEESFVDATFVSEPQSLDIDSVSVGELLIDFLH
jgi:hypothetical protein